MEDKIIAIKLYILNKKMKQHKKNSIVLKSIKDFSTNNTNSYNNQISQISKIFGNSYTYQFTNPNKKRYIKTQICQEQLTKKDSFFKRYVVLATSMQKQKVIDLEGLRLSLNASKSITINVKNNQLLKQTNNKKNRKCVFADKQNKTKIQKQQKKFYIPNTLNNLKVSTIMVEKSEKKQHLTCKLKRLVKELQPLDRTISKSLANTSEAPPIKSVRNFLINTKEKNTRLKQLKKIQRPYLLDKQEKYNNNDIKKNNIYIGPWNVAIEQNPEF